MKKKFNSIILIIFILYIIFIYKYYVNLKLCNTVYFPNYYTTHINHNKNVIIGMLAKYKWDIVKPFFHTLLKSGFVGEIICFVLDESDKIYNKYYSEYNITPIYFSLTHPYLYNESKNYPIPNSLINQIPLIPLDFFFYANLRFFLLNVFLQIYSNRYSYILATDIRDMLFQSNPFNWNYNKGIYLSHETQHCLYKDSMNCSKFNYLWISHFNPSEYMLNQTFINAGQIFGSSNEFKEFIKDYVYFMVNFHFKNRTNEWTCDQGMLNVFVYTRKNYSYPVTIFKAGYGYVRILGLDLLMNKSGFEPDDDLVIRNNDGTIPCMIHQSGIGLKYGEKKRKNIYRQYILKWSK